MTTVEHVIPLTATVSSRGLVTSINPDWPAMTISGAGGDPTNIDVLDGAYATMLQEVSPAGDALGTAIGAAEQLRYDLAGADAIDPAWEITALRVTSVTRYRFTTGASAAGTVWSNVRPFDGDTDLVGPGSFTILTGPGSSDPPAFPDPRDEDIAAGYLGAAVRSADLNVVLQPDELQRVSPTRYTRNVVEIDFLAFAMVATETLPVAAVYPLRQRQRRDW